MIGELHSSQAHRRWGREVEKEREFTTHVGSAGGIEGFGQGRRGHRTRGSKRQRAVRVERKRGCLPKMEGLVCSRLGRTKSADEPRAGDVLLLNSFSKGS